MYGQGALLGNSISTLLAEICFFSRVFLHMFGQRARLGISFSTSWATEILSVSVAWKCRCGITDEAFFNLPVTPS